MIAIKSVGDVRATKQMPPGHVLLPLSNVKLVRSLLRIIASFAVRAGFSGYRMR